MSYRLEAGKSAGKSLRRVAASQIGNAIDEIDSVRPGRAAKVHQVRKRCKKLRALLRLFREPLEEAGIYAAENARFRDAARGLSAMRDGEVLQATLDDVLAAFAGQLEGRSFTEARRVVTRQGKRLKPGNDEADRRLARFRKEMASARKTAEAWDSQDGFEAIAAGLERTYRRARKGLESAYRRNSPESFHEWRKRVKYHGYHMRLLRDLWPEMMGRRQELLEELGGLLGLDHDMTVLRATIMESPGDYGAAREVDVLLALIDTRRGMLEARARPLGTRLFVEKPKRFVQRVEALWNIAADEADPRGPESLLLSA